MPMMTASYRTTCYWKSNCESLDKWRSVLQADEERSRQEAARKQREADEAAKRKAEEDARRKVSALTDVDNKC